MRVRNSSNLEYISKPGWCGGGGWGIEREKPPYSLDFGDVSCYLVATFKVKSAERGINSSLKCSPIKPRLVRIMETLLAAFAKYRIYF